MVLDYVQKLQSNETEELEDSWLRKPLGWTPNGKKLQTANGQLVSVISYCFELIKYLSLELNKVLKSNLDREEKAKELLIEEFDEESENDKDREWERHHMALYDPRNNNNSNGEVDDEGKNLNFGNHLAPLSKLDAMRRVEGQHRTNNGPVGTWDRQSIQPDPSLTVNNEWKTEIDPKTQQTMTSLNDYHEIPLLPSVYNYQSLEELVASLTTVHKHLQQSIGSVSTVLVRKDLHYKTIKQELTTQLVEKRQREEEVVNWSFILKYLLASSTKLRKQLQVEKNRTSSIRGTIVNNNNNQNNNNNSNQSQIPSQRTPTMSMNGKSQQHQPVFVPVLGSGNGNFQQRSFQPQHERRQQQSNERDFDETGSIVSEAPPPPPPLTINVPNQRSQQQPLNNRTAPMSNSSSLPSHQPSPMERLFNNNNESFTPFMNDESNHTKGRSGSNSRPVSANSQSHQQQDQQRRPSRDPSIDDEYEENEEDDQEDPYQNAYDYDSEYSLTSTTRSFRSAATPNSIPLPHYRKSTTKSKGSTQSGNGSMASAIFQTAAQHMQQPLPGSATASSTGSGPRVVNRTEMKDIRSSNPRSRNGSRSSSPNTVPQQQQQMPQPSQQQMQPSIPYNQRPLPNPGSTSGSTTTGRQPQPVPGPVGIADNRRNKSAAVPSSFAQEVVKSLGVHGEQAIAAMSVIDRVSSISPEQLAALDEETRQQILQIRKDLGIDHLFDASGKRAVNVSTIPGFVTTDQRKQQALENHYQRTAGRAASAPRSRSTIETGASKPRSLTPSGPRSPMQNNDAYSQSSHQSRASMPMSAITQSSFGTATSGNRMMQQHQQDIRSPQQDFRRYNGPIDDRSPLTMSTTYSEHDPSSYQQPFGRNGGGGTGDGGKQFRNAGSQGSANPYNRSISPAGSVGSQGSNRWAAFASNNPNNNNSAPSNGAANSAGRSLSPQRLPQQVSD